MPGIESDCSVSFSRRKSRTKCPRTDTKNWSPVGRGRTRRHQIRIKPSLKQWLMVTKSNTVITVLQVNNFFFLYFFFMAYIYRNTSVHFHIFQLPQNPRTVLPQKNVDLRKIYVGLFVFIEGDSRTRQHELLL